MANVMTRLKLASPPNILTATVTQAIVVCLTAVILITAMVSANLVSRHSAFDHATELTVARIYRSAMFHQELTRTVQATKSFALGHQEQDRAEALAALQKTGESLALLEALEGQTASARQPELAQVQERRTAVWTALQEQSAQLLNAEVPADAAAIARGRQELASLETTIRQLQQDTEILVGHDVVAADAQITATLRYGIYSVGGGTILLALVALGALLLRARMLRTLQNLSHAANAVAGGQFDQLVPVTGRDEIGQLQHAFNQMVVNMREHRTRQQAYEDELSRLAFHDSLSGLPNRNRFLQRLDHARVWTEYHAKGFAILFLDLDNFKVINDSLGHQAGDHLLIAVAERLNANLRAHDTLARLGGDEFALLVADIPGVETAIQEAERIQALLRTPFLLDSREVVTTASIGIVYCTSPSFSADDLLRDADIALYQAKRQGKAQYAVFTPSLNAQAHRRLELEAGIRRGLTAGEFRLVYQPIVDLNSEKLVGLEALARWDRPHEGAVQPTEFIPIAEETGLIHPLGQWILEEACRQARAWQLAFPSNPARTISVNLSAKQFRHPTLVADLARTLRATGLDPASLELEITESIAMENGEATFKVLRELKRLGVKLAIDDFGTGYSSLAYLRRFPIDTLKIDGSFVERLGQHPEDTAIVQAITTLANTLNVQIIAEGIETPKQLSYLQMLGAQLGQGYLFAHPMRPESVRTHLAQLDMGLQPAPALAEV